MNKFLTCCYLGLLSISCSSTVVAKEHYDSGAYGGSTGESLAYWGLGGITSTGDYRQGAEVSLTVWRESAGYRLSGVIYGVQNSHDEYNDTYLKRNDAYFGYSASALWGVGDIVKPYLGLGIFVGKNNKNCNDNSNQSNSRNSVYYLDANDPKSRCNLDEYLFSAFPEVGIAMTLGNLQVTPFARFYMDTETRWGDVEASYGLILAYGF